MTRFTQAAVVFSMACGLLACGGQKIGGGKEGAAAALFGASGLSGGVGNSGGGQGQRLTASLSQNIPCPNGGSATVKDLTFNLLDQSGDTSFTLAYNQCSSLTWDNPETTNVETDKVVLDGEMKFTQNFSVNTNTNPSGSIAQTLKGKVNYGGVFSDFIDADVTQSVDFSALSATSGTVTLTLNGTLKTSTQTYTYANEQITFTAGTLIAAQP